jgi:hypothetical protein
MTSPDPVPDPPSRRPESIPQSFRGRLVAEALAADPTTTTGAATEIAIPAAGSPLSNGREDSIQVIEFNDVSGFDLCDTVPCDTVPGETAATGLG